MRKVLIIAHDFPPHGGGGVMRVLKFVKYLPQFDWKPIVLTLRPEYFRWIDEILLAELSGEAIVVRTASLQSKAKSYQKVLDAVHNSPRKTRSMLRAIRQWVYRYFVVYQDEDFLWLPWAWRAAKRILREHQVDAVLTTSPPHCVQWLGLALKKRYRLPWVVDLRDGWMGNPLFRAGFPPRRWVEQRVERAVVHNADRVITATEPIREDLVRDRSSISDKLLVLTNGFDPADFLGHSATRSDKSFDVVYVGSVGGPRRPVEPLFQVVAWLLRQMPELGQVLRLRFVGSFGPTESHLVKEYELSSIVTSTGWVDHQNAIRYMLDADVLLVISSELEGGKDVLTGKLFEYIAAERPILALTPPDAAVSRLVHKAGLGVVASPTNVDGISTAICSLYERFRAGTLESNVGPDFKHQFSRIEQTRILARIFTEAIYRVRSSSASTHSE